MPSTRQIDYDHLIGELLNEGYSLEDAVSEANEIFEDGGFDLAKIFQYTTLKEKETKEALERNLLTVENAAVEKDTILNASFAFQGLRQALKGADEFSSSGALKLVESRKTFRVLLAMLKLVADSSIEDEDNVDNMANGEDSDEDDDPEENLILQKASILDFALLVLTMGAKHFKNLEEHTQLNEDAAKMLLKLLDDDMAEPRVSKKVLELLAQLCGVEGSGNREVLLECSARDLLELTTKVNKRNAAVQALVSSVLAVL